MRDIVVLAWRHHRKHQIAVVVLSIFVAGISAVPLELQRRIVDGAIADSDVDLLTTLIGALAGVLILQGIAKYKMRMLRHQIAENAMRDIRQQTFCGVSGDCRNVELEAENGDDDNRDEGERGTAMSIITAEVRPFGGFVGEVFSIPLSEGGVLLVVFGYLLYIQPWVALAALAVFIPQMILVPIVQRRINNYVRRHTEELRKVGDELDDESTSADKTIARLDKVFSLQMRRFRLKYLLKLATNLMNHAATLIILGLGGWLAIQGEIAVGVIVAFLSGIERVADPWRELITYYRTASDAAMRQRQIKRGLDAIAGARNGKS
ncbi:MAG: ABC transporter ATP-binding protein [Rhodospirillales bacterium]